VAGHAGAKPRDGKLALEAGACVHGAEAECMFRRAGIAEAPASDGDAADACGSFHCFVVYGPPIRVEVEGHDRAAVLCVCRAIYANAIAEGFESLQER